MPSFFNPSASILRELFVINALFPFLSVGPEPAIINTSGVLLVIEGVSKVPLMLPDLVLRIISFS